MVDREAVICTACLRTSTDPPPYPKYCERSRIREPDGKTPHQWRLLDSDEGKTALVERKRIGGLKPTFGEMESSVWAATFAASFSFTHRSEESAVKADNAVAALRLLREKDSRVGVALRPEVIWSELLPEVIS